LTTPFKSCVYRYHGSGAYLTTRPYSLGEDTAAAARCCGLTWWATLITWDDDAFAEQYEQWSAHMTADISFYADLAREATRPLWADLLSVSVAHALAHLGGPAADI
jgi:hypothetical protein